MKQLESKNKNFQDITNEYNKFLEALKEKNSKYREALPDDNCKKIYDAVFLDAKSKNIYTIKFTELLKLTGMTRPTLSKHLNHLEEKGFITKKAETKYKTFYKINLIRAIKVCKIKKTITGKEKLELTDITKIRTGDSFIPMVPLVPIPKDPTSSSSNKKSKGYFKAHKNKR